MITTSLPVEPVDVPGQQEYDDRLFPLVLASQSTTTLEATCEWVRNHRKDLLAQSAQVGAILFRGFPLVTAEDFDAFVAAFDLPNFTYYESLSNAVRVNKTP